MDAPGIDSPETPRTPDSQGDKTLPSKVSEPLSIAECHRLARTVQLCSKSLIDGSWHDVPSVRSARPRFRPSNFESAKAYFDLLDTVRVLPPRRVQRLSFDTPVSSKYQPSSAMFCHGCHGPMGQGLHNGSAPGKNVCSFVHSNLCKGGIPESDSFKACPDDYIYMATVPTNGFENTMNTVDFQPTSNQQYGPGFSTPAVSGDPSDQFLTPQNQQLLSNSGQVTADQQRAQDLDRLRRQAEGEGGRSRVTGVANLPTTTPDEGDHDVFTAPPAAPENGVQSGHITESIQRNIDSFRSENQNRDINLDRIRTSPNITQLRRDSTLRADVEENIVGFRQRIPSLSAHETATVPVVNGQIGQAQHGAYNYSAAQLHQVAGDGIRVTGTARHQHSPTSAHISVITSSQQHHGPLLGDHHPHGQPSQTQGLQPVRLGQNLVPPFQQAAGVSVSLPGQSAPQLSAGVGRSMSQPTAGVPTLMSGYTAPQFTTPQAGQRLVLGGGQHDVARSAHIPLLPNLPPLHPQHLQQGLVGRQCPQSTLQQPSVQHAAQVTTTPFHQQTYPQHQLHQPDVYGVGSAVGQQYSGHQHVVTPPMPVQSTFKTEFRCDPVTGRQWQVQVPVQGQAQIATKIEYRCSPTSGRLWKIQVPVQPSPQALQPAEPPRSRYEWRIHPHTGSTYQVQVQEPNFASPAVQVQQQQGGQTATIHRHQHEQPLQHSQFQTPPAQSYLNAQLLQESFQQQLDGQQQPGTAGAGSLNQQVQDRVAGIVNLMGGGSSKKQPRIIDFAKKCPAKWAKQATLTNINLPLYTWGAISELESSLSGRSEPMKEGDLVGKLRHLKNVMEVCCLNSPSSDFSSYGWTLAKDYATKVEDEVEQKLTAWYEMSTGARTATLLAAQMDCPRPVPKLDPKGQKVPDKAIGICFSYNKCTTEGKCQYEVENPTKTCLRKHECSWCKINLRRSNKHQELRCKNKGKESG